MVKRKELDQLKSQIRQRTEKATDMDILCERIFALPHGQLKKVLTTEVMAVLEKYGYKIT